MLEQPRSSIMTALPEWKSLQDMPRISSVWTSSCAFGSPHLKQFVFLCSCLDASSIHRKCSCQGKHLPVKGRHAKASATYVHGLVVSIGSLLTRALRARHLWLSEVDLDVSGLERVSTTDLAQALPWRVVSDFAWPNEVHINILEASVLARLYKKVAIEEGRCRFVALCDSHVAQASLAKGRSPAVGLRHVTRRSSMVSLAAGLYPASLFCPTRAMPADHPTRSAEIPPCIPGLGESFWTSDRLRLDAKLPRLRRWAASWLRLVLLLNRQVFPSGPCHRSMQDGHLNFSTFVSSRGFDSTLGFPGEGPSLAGLVLVCFAFFQGLFRVSPSLLAPLLFLSSSAPCAAMETARAGKDLERLQRRLGVELPTGRPVLPYTQARRRKLRELLTAWLERIGVTWDFFLARSKRDPDYANEVLISYGRELFQNGRPYFYSETLNLCTSECPGIRRLAFAWLREEPPEHHTAMPWQVVIALITAALLHGWTAVAGALAICWGGLARVGELLAAKREDLVLPEDTGEECAFALLAVLEPKTRFKAARHQCLRVDQPQLLRVLKLAFASLAPMDKLWPQSPSTLRARFKKLLQIVGLREHLVQGVKDFDLGSLRAGGATWLMQCTEDPEYVRRRGRWITTKVMDIYVQEVTAILYLPKLPGPAKDKIFLVANSAAELWSQWQIPATAWYFLASHGAMQD